MEELAHQISIQAEGTSNVLIIELREGEELIPYCRKIMETNSIPGLLRMNHQYMDGVISLRYNIGGKVRLGEFMLQNHLSYANGILLLRNLSNALLGLNEYFLSTDMCYLDPNYIYVGDGLLVYLPCVPLQKEYTADSATRLKAFYEKLLSEYFATADSTSYDEMFKWVYKASLFDLESFNKLFLQEGTQRQPVQPVQNTRETPAAPPVVTPLPTLRKDEQEMTEGLRIKIKEAQVLYYGMSDEPDDKKVHAAPEKEKAPHGVGPAGISVPGSGNFEIPKKAGAATDKKKKESTAKEKKALWPFAGHVDKEEAQEPPVKAPEKSPLRRETKKAALKKPAASPDTPAFAVPAAGDEWDSGTILVDGENQRKPPAPSHPVKGAYLVHNGKNVCITETPFLIGKYNTACRLHYAIHDNNKVSRNHLTILFDKGQYLARDNQSRNGTFLNGQPILPLQPVALKDGDEVKLYDEAFIFHLE